MHFAKMMCVLGAVVLCTSSSQTALAAPPPNDNCIDATVIAAVPFTDLAIDITQATDDDVNAADDPSCDQFCGAGLANNGVWWIYTPPADCVATIGVSGTNSTQDTVAAVFTGMDCKNLIENHCANTTTKPANVAMTASVQHWILVSKRSCLAEPSDSIDFTFDCVATECGNDILEPLEQCDDGNTDPGDGCDESCQLEAPPNDDCAGAEPLGPLPTTVTVNNTAATDDPESQPFCGTSSVNQAVWYSVVGTGNIITATTCNQGGDFDNTDLQIWCADCDALTCVTGNGFDFNCLDNGGPSLSRATVSWCSQPGATYLIAVGGGGDTDAGSIQLDVSDDGVACGNPPVACPDIFCQVGDPSLVDRSNRVDNAVADDFTPAENGSITDISWWGAYLNIIGEDCQGVSPDTFEVTYYADDGEGVPGAVIAGPFSQLGGTLTVGAPVATGGSVQGPFGPIPEFEFSASHAAVSVLAGQCYWMEITNLPSETCDWFWESSLAGNLRGMMDGLLNEMIFVPPDGFDPGDKVSNDYGFCLDIPLGDPTICLPPPAMNDDCIDAKPIAGDPRVGGSVFAFDNSTATTDGPPHPSCGFGFNDNVNSDVWFCWTAPCDLEVSIETCDRTCVDTRIAVYDGCTCPVSDANLLACNDDGCAANPETCTGGQAESHLTFDALAGQSYLIRLGGKFSNSQGEGTFKIECIPDLPTPICEQPLKNCQDRNVESVITSDRTHFIAADDFTPATTGSVTDVCWWGVYATGIPSPDTFEVRYYEDATGIPGALIGGPFSQAGGTLTVDGPAGTGLLVGGSDVEFEYTGTHAPVPVAAGECYWIEISNATDGSQSWFWELSRAGIGTADQSLWSVQDGTPGCGTQGIPPDGFDFGDRRNIDLAFCVDQPLVDPRVGGPTECTPPLINNDDCSAAARITGEGAFPFDIMDATTDGLAHAACAEGIPPDDQIDQDVWAVWTASCTGDVVVDTCGLTAAPTRLAVYEGSACPGTDARLLDCNRDSCGQSQSRVAFSAVSGQEYLIRLGSDFCFGACDGFFSISCAPVPENDQCAAAAPITVVPSTVSGSTKYATIDNDVAFGCGNAGIASPGVWYTVTGTGNTMTASLCNDATKFCTRLSVFCGDCDDLTCIAGAGIPVCAGQSEISWCSQADVTYSILVHGDDFILDTGPFELDVSDDGAECEDAINCVADVGACCTELVNCVLTTEQECQDLGGTFSGDGSTCPCPTNDFCADALGPLPVPSVTPGTTDAESVTPFDESSFPDCGTATTSGQSWGVWYTVIGTGTTITASLCNEATDFDTQLSVYCDECETPICVDGDDNFCGGGAFGSQSQVSWCAEAGRTYRILVHGGLFAVGTFELELTEDGASCPSGCPPPPPANDECTGAIGPLPIPSTTAGTTDRATVDSTPEFCGTGITAPGVWYTVVGTGNTMTATTCTDFFNFDTKISVYCGDCDDLTCIDGNDDDCAGGASIRLSTVTWCSQAGATYLILVHSFGANFGDFELDISSDGAACEPKVKCPSCAADLSGNGIVEAFDLGILLGAWGPCAEPCMPGDPAATCAEDLNGDCEISAFDLGILLGAWGPCL